jgi:hypothetical protein
MHIAGVGYDDFIKSSAYLRINTHETPWCQSAASVRSMNHFEAYPSCLVNHFTLFL